MLDTLRRGSTGWVAKILLAVLVLSFAVWGVADVFTGYGRGSLAKVGSTEIPVSDFQRAFQNELDTISQQSGRRISAEEARAAGLDDRILSQLMAWAAIEEHAVELNLAMADKAIADSMMRDPNFQGPNGQFSRINFENMLGRLGLNERGFLALRRRDELREQVTTAIANGVAVPDAMIDVMHEWKNETRRVDEFTIDAAKAVTVPDPTEEQIKQTYENNQNRFRAPEYRKLAILMLTVDDLKGEMEVSEEEIANYYADNKKKYDTPERRRLQQIAFKDKAAAQAAKAALDGGKSFGEIAKEAGAGDADIDLGLVTKEDLIDPKIADVAFGLDKDSVSDIVEGRFATVLLRVTDIRPAVEQTLDDVKDEVRDTVAKTKAENAISSRHDEMEDNRAAGKTLKEIADIMKLNYLEIASVDRLNKEPDGKPAIVLTDARTLVDAGFNGEVGLESEAVELSGGGYGWVDVLDITEPRQKTFNEVKEAAKTLTIDNERNRLVSELAEKLVARADQGEDMSKLATEAGAPKVNTTPPFNRTTLAHGLTKKAVERAFALPKGKAASVPTADSKSRIVFKVTEITPAPELTKEQREQIVSDLKKELTNDSLIEYVVAMQERLGTSINETELKRATGADTE